ncbi:MAG: HD domain-containing protein [Alicyclobacillus sp.]|nr:HD domain-containing protein [Alicyclobacillus sp.]
MDYSPFLKAAREASSKDPAHDFLHVERVLKNAQLILREVPADVEVVVPAVLLHELFNYPKNHPRSKYSGDICAEYASRVLDKYNYPRLKRDKVLDCIKFYSFFRGVVPEHIEGKIVQDADRLDAIGAIGIARLFATCVDMGRLFYDSSDPFGENREFNDKLYGLDHFYTKLLKLAEGMHTNVAREMARQRTQFMLDYIEQLRSEIC